MRYGIARVVIGSKDFAEISKADYERYREAKRGVLAILQIEEKMDMVLKNHMELEVSLLEIALKDVMFGAFDWHRGREQVHEINRRTINLLSSVRLYRDQVAHDLSQIYGKKTFSTCSLAQPWSYQRNWRQRRELSRCLNFSAPQRKLFHRG